MKNSEITTVAHFGQRQIRQARHELVEFGAGVVDPRFVKLSVANKPSDEKRVATCFIIGEERPSPFFIKRHHEHAVHVSVLASFVDLLD